MRPNDTTWNPPPLSTASRNAEVNYRRGIAALVAGLGHAGDVLEEAVRIDPDFFLARVGVAVARTCAGKPYAAPVQTSSLFRGERQHAEIVHAALSGDRRHAADLRTEHLLEYPGDLLIVWLPALGVLPRRPV